MSKRPEFKMIKSYDEFKKYYWYRQELSKICKELNIDHTGTKQELNHNIEEYFKGNLISKKKKHVIKNSCKEITMDSPLLDCGFSFNARFRQFFSKQTGIENFKFTADMATAWRKVKHEQNHDFTIGDMLAIYYHKSDYAKYDNSSCQWNTFLKDFCKDKRNEHFKNKMKTAAILWQIVKESSLPKIYTYDLVLKYKDKLDG